jgi:AcrR family transcriptional regulator
MKHGIRSVSMDDLARHLGMSKKTIYQYFENKDNLVSAMILEHCEQEKKEVESILLNSDNALDQMQMIARMALRTLDEVSSGTMFDLQKYYRTQWIAITDLHKTLIHSVIKQNIEQGINEGIYRVDIDADIIARLYGEMAFSVINIEVFPLKEYSMQEVYKQAFHYHINAILSSKGKKMIQKLNTTAE